MAKNFRICPLAYKIMQNDTYTSKQANEHWKENWACLSFHAAVALEKMRKNSSKLLQKAQISVQDCPVIYSSLE